MRQNSPLNRRRRRARVMFCSEAICRTGSITLVLTRSMAPMNSDMRKVIGGEAELLVAHVTDHQTDRDFLVYPIIFLYRHHVELMLKSILRRAPY